MTMSSREKKTNDDSLPDAPSSIPTNPPGATDSATPGVPAMLGGQPAWPAGPPPWPRLDADVTTALNAAIANGSWGHYHGEHCDGLTADLQEFLNCDHVELVCSGSAAVELALVGCRVQPGDEVVMPAYDYKANVGNVLAMGAKPVLVDILFENGTLNPLEVSAAVSSRTRAILVSHLHGGMVNMPAIRAIADDHQLPVIEDACQVTGGTVCGQQAGLSGDVGVWSFGGSKLMTAGRGGAVFSRNPQLAQRIRLYARRNNQVYPLSQIQAAAVRPQLQRLSHDNEIRSAAVQRLHSGLARSCPDVLQPFENTVACEPAWYKVGFRFNGAGELSRDQFVAAVRAEGVALDRGFPGLHLTHSRRRFRAAGHLTEATKAHHNYVALHHPVLLEGDAEVDKVVHSIARVVRNANEIARTFPPPDH